MASYRSDCNQQWEMTTMSNWRSHWDSCLSSEWRGRSFWEWIPTSKQWRWPREKINLWAKHPRMTILTLVRTAQWETAERISFQMPMSDALRGIGRLYFERNFQASRRSSTRLLTKANKGASLNSKSESVRRSRRREATKKDKRTEKRRRREWRNQIESRVPDIHSTVHRKRSRRERCLFPIVEQVSSFFSNSNVWSFDASQREIHRYYWWFDFPP